MGFAPNVIELAWRRSKGYCECKRVTHKHPIPHKMRLEWANRNREDAGKWNAYSVSGEYQENINDCIILCGDCFVLMK
jgi:hypothetical protein